MDKLTFDGNRKLFRGKNEKGIWFFGSLLQCQDIFGNSEVFIYQSEKTGNWRQHKILDSKTIAQFTGYTLNGQDVFEKDILYFEEKYVGLICFGPYQKDFGSSNTEHLGFYVEWTTLVNGYPEPYRLFRKDLGYWLRSEKIVIAKGT